MLLKDVNLFFMYVPLWAADECSRRVLIIEGGIQMTIVPVGSPHIFYTRSSDHKHGLQDVRRQ